MPIDMNSKELRIAVILTCFNRKDKTLNCIESLFKYSKEFLRRKIILDVYLTDDGCTDGTSEALREKYSDSNLTILQGDGNLFWAGGMRVAWKAALDSNKSFDYFLLVNDDVEFLPNFFEQLLSAVEFGECKYNKKPVVSGFLKDSETEEETYGGKIWVNKFLGTCKHLRPTGTPQNCDMAHANILLVPTYVVEKIGIFNTDYIHGGADHDYTLYANRHGIPVLVTSNYCGICNNDHEG
jgi:GT2 family glycosyltransferase